MSSMVAGGRGEKAAVGYRMGANLFLARRIHLLVRIGINGGGCLTLL